MYSIEKDGEKPSIEDDKEHTELYVPEDRCGVANTKKLSDSIGFEDSKGKGYPGNRAQGSEYLDDRTEEPVEKEVPTNQEPQWYPNESCQ